MHPTSPSRRWLTLTFASAFVIGTAGLGALAFVTPATAASSPEVSSSPTHIWVDPTVRNANNKYEWSAVIHMPPITSHAVIHSTVVPFATGVMHCQAPAATDGGVLSCEGEGDAIPGEYTVTMELRSEGDQNYFWEIPLTVCPLTGCSDLFSLTVSPTPIVVWANPTITEQTYGQYDFNVDWNATEVRMQDNLLDAQGNPAQGIYDLKSEIPGNGSRFGYYGTFTQPGYYYSTVTMIDEFGGEHEAPFTVRVCTPETCADLLKLPDTGVAATANTAGGAFAVLAVGAGAFMLVVRRRKS